MKKGLVVIITMVLLCINVVCFAEGERDLGAYTISCNDGNVTYNVTSTRELEKNGEVMFIQPFLTIGDYGNGRPEIMTGWMYMGNDIDYICHVYLNIDGIITELDISNSRARHYKSGISNRTDVWWKIAKTKNPIIIEMIGRDGTMKTRYLKEIEKQSIKQLVSIYDNQAQKYM